VLMMFALMRDHDKGSFLGLGGERKLGGYGTKVWLSYDCLIIIQRL